MRAGKARPWRLRGWLVGGTFAAIAALALLVLPGVITRHTAAMVPSAKRAEIGQTALDDLTRLTGSPCDGELGLPALADLSERVFGPEDTPILYVLPEGLSRPAHLPGGMILLPRALVDADQPDALAGAALAEGMAAKSHDPMLDVLNHAGLRATFTMLTSGALPDRALSGYGEEILRQTSPDIPLNALTIAFRDAQIPMAPYARWLERQPGQAERAASLLAADPYRDLAPSPLMPDDNWIALQSVCSG